VSTDRLAELVRFYETLAPQTLGELARFYVEDAYFRDPFNEVRRRADIEAIFARMFDSLDAPRFTVTGRFVQGEEAVLLWEFEFAVRAWRPRERHLIGGVSHLRFTPDGRVAAHRDYWDAAELYETLPVLGAVLRAIKRRMA
jgi:steroid delta-isomerase